MNRSLPIHDHASLGPAALAQLAAEVAGLETLEDLLRWGRVQQPPVLVEEAVGQDEFTNDLLVPWRGGLTLVYDTT